MVVSLQVYNRPRMYLQLLGIYLPQPQMGYREISLESMKVSALVVRDALR